MLLVKSPTTPRDVLLTLVQPPFLQDVPILTSSPSSSRKRGAKWWTPTCSPNEWMNDAGEDKIPSGCASASTANVRGVVRMRLGSHLFSLLHFLWASAWPGLASATQRLCAAISPWPHQHWDRNTVALTIMNNIYRFMKLLKMAGIQLGQQSFPASQQASWKTFHCSAGAFASLTTARLWQVFTVKVSR